MAMIFSPLQISLWGHKMAQDVDGCFIMNKHGDE